MTLEKQHKLQKPKKMQIISPKQLRKQIILQVEMTKKHTNYVNQNNVNIIILHHRNHQPSNVHVVEQKIVGVVDTVHVTNAVKRNIFHQWVLVNQIQQIIIHKSHYQINIGSQINADPITDNNIHIRKINIIRNITLIKPRLMNTQMRTFIHSN